MSDGGGPSLGTETPSDIRTGSGQFSLPTSPGPESLYTGHVRESIRAKVSLTDPCDCLVTEQGHWFQAGLCNKDRNRRLTLAQTHLSTFLPFSSGQDEGVESLWSIRGKKLPRSDTMCQRTGLCHLAVTVSVGTWRDPFFSP